MQQRSTTIMLIRPLGSAARPLCRVGEPRPVDTQLLKAWGKSRALFRDFYLLLRPHTPSRTLRCGRSSTLMTLVRVSLCLAMFAVQNATSMLISTSMHPPALPAFHVRRSTIAMQSKDAPWKGLNEMNKMKAMKVSPPKVRGQKLPADMVEVTQSFKKEYARKDLEQLWGAVMAIYGSQTLAKQAVLENPQVWRLYPCTPRAALTRATVRLSSIRPRALEQGHVLAIMCAVRITCLPDL